MNPDFEKAGFTRIVEDEQEILYIKPNPLGGPLVSVKTRYEIIDRSILNIRTLNPKKLYLSKGENDDRFVSDVTGIKVTDGPITDEITSKNLIFSMQDGEKFIWENVPRADIVKRFIQTLRRPDSAPFQTMHNSQKENSPSSVALHDDPIKEARESRRTGFGNEENLANSNPPKQCENWIIHGDGTATDEHSGLMWIQAPWGKKWTGNSFTGDAIKLTWPEATELFGKGCRGSHDTQKNMAHLTEKNFADTDYVHGYRHGYCTVHFAGYTDWRLPTANELRNFLLLDTTTYRKVMKEVFFDDIRDHVWSATPKGIEFTYTRTMRFIINTQKALGRKNLYQNAQGQTCVYQNAWRFTLGNMDCRYIDEGQEFPFKILFVRRVK
ncbi:Lcl domain-containing protein [Nitrospira sp. T9]|uniref:Lcl domain-containing protein n=1 Tax=unclassified Nitrospira TaxID=2652172 RepID=UPI003F97FBB2